MKDWEKCVAKNADYKFEYYSSSKDKWIPFEEMHENHLMNVIKKMKTQNLDKIIVENYFDTTVARRIQKSVKNVKISVVPVAVRGNDKVDTIIDLYNVLALELGK